MTGGFGLNKPAGAAAAAGLWQAGDPGFITPVANVGLQVPLTIQLAEQAIPPPAALNTGHIYTFDVLGVSEFHYMDSAGVVTQLTGAGGILFHSLQNAYDDGVVIATTGPLGAITFNNLIADNSNVLDITRTNVIAGGRGVTITMPAVYGVGDIVGLEITGDGREVEICNNDYTIQVVAGNVFLADTLEIQFGNATQLIRGNGAAMEFTNTTLLGDMDFATTREITFSVAGGQELSINTNAILVTSATQLQFGLATIFIQDNGVDVAFTNATALGDMDFATTVEMTFSVAGGQELSINTNAILVTALTQLQLGAITRTIVDSGNQIRITNSTAAAGSDIIITNSGSGGGTITLSAFTSFNLSIGGAPELVVTTNAFLITAASQLQFGAITRHIVDNGVDLEITNTTALGDIITNATVEIREEINSVVRTILDSNTYSNQVAATLNTIRYDTYSTTNDHRNIMYFRKSDNNTLGTITQTDNGDRIAQLIFQGVTSVPGFQSGAIINVQQNGASGAAGVPTDFSIYTYSNAGPNTNQFVLRNDGSVEIARGEPIKFFDSAANDLSYIEQMEPLATANAVQTTMHTITLDDNHTYAIEVMVASQEDDASDRRGFIKSGVFYRDGGGAVQQGVTISIMNEGSAVVLLDFTVNGNDVRVSITGIAAEDWRHTGHVRIVELD